LKLTRQLPFVIVDVVILNVVVDVVEVFVSSSERKIIQKKMDLR